MKHIFLIVLILTLTGCFGSKKVTEKTITTKQTEKIEIKKDSSKIVNTNKAIKDKVITSVPSVTPEIDALVDEVLSKLNTSKSSGSNSYNQKYNKDTREIVTDIEIGETQDVAINTNMETAIEKSFEQKIDEYIFKKIKVMPWYIYGLLIFLFRNQLIGLLSFFFPGIKAIKTFTDLRKKFTPKIRSPVE